MNKRIKLATGAALIVGAGMVPLSAMAGHGSAPSPAPKAATWQMPAMASGSTGPMASGSGMTHPMPAGNPGTAGHQMPATHQMPAGHKMPMGYKMPAVPTKKHHVAAVEGGFGSSMNSGGHVSADGGPAGEGHGDNQGGDIH